MRPGIERLLAATAIDAARNYLAGYALVTDAPDPSVVDAADLLDAAAEWLAIADFAGAIKGARAGDE